MELNGHIPGRIARLHPVLALGAALCVIAVGEVAGYFTAEYFEPNGFQPESQIYITVTTAVAMFFYLGYPVAIAIHVLKMRGPITQVRPSRMAAAVLVMLAAYATGSASVAWLMPDRLSFGIIMGGVTFAWLAGAVYILWTAARGLVQAEEGCTVASNRMFGTFLMFYALPVFIYFLQRRVRRLYALD